MEINRTGGQLLIEALRQQGTDHVFCVPGESFLSALDGLHGMESIRTVICRQEGGAAMMADAYGKLTHRPGVCFVSRGPGASNAASGIHIASQDSTPLVMFVGQIERSTTGREAFQEIDYRAMFGYAAKRVEQIEDVDRIPEVVSRAFHTAVNGRAGPVVVALPEDMLRDTTTAQPVALFRRIEPAPGAAVVAEFEERLIAARKPIMIVGGRGWRPDTKEKIQQFSEDWDLRLVAGFRFQDCVDNDHNHYIGELGLGTNPVLTDAIQAADLLIVLGVRLGELTTAGYTLIDIPVPRQQLVHIYPGMEELGSVYYPTLAINASVNQFANVLPDLGGRPADPPWSALRKQGRQAYLDWTKPVFSPGRVNLSEVICSLNDFLPDDAIIANGAGNYTAWVHRFYRYRTLGSQLAPTAGSMGYGLPAAVAAKLVQPHRPAIVFAGDGCFMMTGQELATAVQYQLSVVIVIVNNGMFGTIRMHQERRFPGRVIGTELVNPDFCALAQAYGAHAERVEETAAFLPTLRRALDISGPALIELIVDPEAITPARTLSDLTAGG